MGVNRGVPPGLNRKALRMSRTLSASTSILDKSGVGPPSWRSLDRELPMSRHVLRCSAPDHESHKGKPGWSDKLGEVELPGDVAPTVHVQGYLCGACGEAVRAKPRKRAMPAAAQLALLTRAVHALSQGQPLAAEDQALLSDLSKP